MRNSVIVTIYSFKISHSKDYYIIKNAISLIMTERKITVIKATKLYVNCFKFL